MSDNKIKQLEEELEQVKKQAQEYLDGWKRAKADYINREREVERDKSVWLEFINVDFLLKLLPIFETFEQALKHQDKNEDFLKGIEQIKKQFEDLLKSFGLEKIKTVGEKFNPEFHEAVGRSTANSQEQMANGKGQIADSKEQAANNQEPITNNIIIEEVGAGYMMNGRAIKPAKVIVR